MSGRQRVLANEEAVGIMEEWESQGEAKQIREVESKAEGRKEGREPRR